MSKRLVCLLFVFAFIIPVFSQENKELQESFFEAEYFLMNEDYPDALIYYLALYEKLPENANLAYCIGVCYLNIPLKKNLAVDYLVNASKNMSARHREGSITQTTAPYEALYDLGRAYRINFKFDKAIDAFTRYLETLLPDDRENLDFVKHEIAACDRAKALTSTPISYTEENMGDLFNDEKDNFNPLISTDGKSFAYEVALKFYNAVMFSRNANGKWTAPLNITPELQLDGDFYISCLSSDGKLLLLSMDDNVNSDIYASSFDGHNWSKALKLNKNINTKYWESHGFISQDGNSLIFASDRPGGFGGLDLYISRKTDGDWSSPVNLGPEINTQFNDDRPFLINNGKTVFFSSQGHNNIGGYDIFRSDLESNGLWSKPKNLGYPVNTPDDDIFFMPVSDGKSGYYSRYKVTGGFGKEDIYKITFK